MILSLVHSIMVQNPEPVLDHIIHAKANRERVLVAESEVEALRAECGRLAQCLKKSEIELTNLKGNLLRSDMRKDVALSDAQTLHLHTRSCVVAMDRYNATLQQLEGEFQLLQASHRSTN